MLIRIISLVFLFTTLNLSTVLSDEKTEFVYPKDKPSVFKKINTSKIVKKKNTLPKKKPQFENLNEVDEKKVIAEKKIPKKIKIKDKLKTKSVSKFLYPKKKPVTYKVSLSNVEKSKILGKKDFERAKETFRLIKTSKWNSAIKYSEKVKNKEFQKLVKWMYLKQNGNRATFSEYKDFITKNNYYPRINRLKYLAEHKIIVKNTTPTNIINWFEKNPPLSGTGKLKLAEAHLKKGDIKIVNELVKLGWTNAQLSKNDLRYYRNKFKKFLSTDDHINRADYLAWNKKYWDLKRMLRYLPKDEKALYNARQILMSNSYGVDKSISDVPSHLKKNIGLEFDRLKWRNRRGRLEASLEILYENGNKSEEALVRADLWWKQRESIVRTLIYKKRYKTAYKVASEHSLTSGANFAEAEWLAGWIALSFLNSGEYAVNHFENFYNNVSYPISLARGAYWLGKSYQSLEDKENSNKYFKEGSVFLTTYYGQLSFNEIKYGEEFILKDNSDFTKEYEKEFNKDPLIKLVILLSELNMSQYGKDIIKHLATINIDKGSEILAAKLATDIERYDFAIQISKKASYEKRFYNKYNYPIISTPREINKKSMPEPEYILSIIRQESEFDRKANSYVGARGMMQLMKYTAKIVAKQAKLPYSISGLTKDPVYNIKLGSYYFNSLLEQYDGVYPFAIAAYNAGPNRVKTWRRVNGDPTKKEISYVNWIELIRFKETRNYVQRVLENVNVYKYMINQGPVNIDRFFK
jgi:soluble lytic murein transglycosylase